MSNNLRTYSFKSVGQKDTDIQSQKLATQKQTPIGILTPVSFDKSGGTLFSMSFDINKQIKDNLKNLILTNRGERLMMTDFGADLRVLATEFTNEDIVSATISKISDTVAKYMPFIELENFETRVDPSLNSSTVGVVVRITYSVPFIGVTNQAVETTIYAVG